MKKIAILVTSIFIITLINTYQSAQPSVHTSSIPGSLMVGGAALFATGGLIQFMLKQPRKHIYNATSVAYIKKTKDYFENENKRIQESWEFYENTYPNIKRSIVQANNDTHEVMRGILPKNGGNNTIDKNKTKEFINKINNISKQIEEFEKSILYFSRKGYKKEEWDYGSKDNKQTLFDLKEKVLKLFAHVNRYKHIYESIKDLTVINNVQQFRNEWFHAFDEFTYDLRHLDIELKFEGKIEYKNGSSIGNPLVEKYKKRKKLSFDLKNWSERTHEFAVQRLPNNFSLKRHTLLASILGGLTTGIGAGMWWYKRS